MPKCRILGVAEFDRRFRNTGVIQIQRDNSYNLGSVLTL